MAIGEDIFCAKIMLFGEYSLMAGSAALIMPYDLCSARFRIPEKVKKSDIRSIAASNNSLQQYCDYLSVQPDLPIQWQVFRTDIQNGLFFDSDIPSGYGLGSSGALVAAVYKRYAGHNKMKARTGKRPGWEELKNLFARMESFFHGSSSGIDPLCIYAGQTLLLDDQGKISSVALPQHSANTRGGLFLVDTGQKAATAPLVAAFRSAYKQASFAGMLQQEYIPLNDACIKACLKGDAEELGRCWSALSALQQTYFSGMIPAAFKKIWSAGLQNKSFALKLCGSGGGGYLLGYTADYAHAKTQLSPHKLLPLSLFSGKLP